MLHKRPKSIGKRENGIDGFERAEKSVDTFSQNSRLFFKISRLFFRLVTTPYMNTGMWRHSLSNPTVDKLNYGAGGLLPTPNLSGAVRKAGGNSSVLRRRSHGCGLSFIVRISFLRLDNFALLVSGLFHSLFVDSCVSLGGGMVLYCKEPPYI